jgi:hypothetical protein
MTKDMAQFASKVRYYVVPLSDKLPGLKSRKLGCFAQELEKTRHTISSVIGACLRDQSLAWQDPFHILIETSEERFYITSSKRCVRFLNHFYIVLFSHWCFLL